MVDIFGGLTLLLRLFSENCHTPLFLPFSKDNCEVILTLFRLFVFGDKRVFSKMEIKGGVAGIFFTERN